MESSIVRVKISVESLRNSIEQIENRISGIDAK
jgi:hypothetical protein